MAEDPTLPTAVTGVDAGPATDYSTYLRIDDLLHLQNPLTPGAHDEMLFIVIHQVFELWFKLILHELTMARDQLTTGAAHEAVAPLRRVIAIERVLIEQLSVLETMGPDGFLEFRDPLAPASGFQSTQFREIELISGFDAGHGDRLTGDAAGHARMMARTTQSSIWTAFCLNGTQLSLPMPIGDDDAAHELRMESLATLYRTWRTRPEVAALHEVAELLVDHDEAVVRWRTHHALMAAREIGSRHGTGGSPGVQYLQSTLGQRFFPELWEVRNRL